MVMMDAWPSPDTVAGKGAPQAQERTAARG
jgi:hypothetical protein